MSERSQIVVDTAISLIGSPYVFGAWGEYCTPANRRKRENADHPTIVSKCQVLNGTKSSCAGCKWDGDRMFDCRGFTHFCLLQAGVDIKGQGATSQWNTEANWDAKGKIEDMPPDCVCCVFVRKGTKMEHTGLYIGGGETIECSNGVERSPHSKKWTHFAIPRGLDQKIVVPDKLEGECIVDVPNDGTVNVRSAPKANAKIMTTRREGQTVTVLSDDGTWTKVIVEGYIMSKFLKKA